MQFAFKQVGQIAVTPAVTMALSILTSMMLSHLIGYVIRSTFTAMIRRVAL
jgi:hypothetical protein